MPLLFFDFDSTLLDANKEQYPFINFPITKFNAEVGLTGTVDFEYYIPGAECGDFLTESELDNEYLPVGMTQTDADEVDPYRDIYPEVAIFGFPYYKKFELVSGTETSNWLFVSGELPSGLTFDENTGEIYGIVEPICYIENNTIPFNQWVYDDYLPSRNAIPIIFTFTIRASCSTSIRIEVGESVQFIEVGSDFDKEFTLKVYPNWTPYKVALNNSIEYFEKEKVTNTYPYNYEEPKKHGLEKIDGSSLCEICTTTENSDSSVINTTSTFMREYSRTYQHELMRIHFESESTCTPFTLDNNDTEIVNVYENKKPASKKKLQKIDKTGICCDAGGT